MTPTVEGVAFGLLNFADPLWFLALIPVAGWLVAPLLRRPQAIPWPALEEARLAGGQRLDLLRPLSTALRLAAAAFLVAVLAGPVVVQHQAAEGSGLDLMLVLDASGSMDALDAEISGEWRRRIDLAREVVARFARQRVADGDRVGLVVFGRSAFTQCPLTRDGRLLAAALERVDVGVAGEATALGDALALAVKRSGGGTSPNRDTGRLVILLTDGRSNAGSVPVDVATGIARARGVRVHTVGIGSEGEVAMASPEGSARRGMRFQRHDLDAAALERIANATGGRFYRVRSSADLEHVYAQIDALERVPRPLPEEVRRSPAPEPLLAAAGGLLLLEIAVARLWRRRLP